ncbi:MAG TPA: hypothetical protein PKC19_09030, partial [Roseiflexaceae bacterium]|nr:hypothetical protein [Roseiflexaceae bacterium]
MHWKALLVVAVAAAVLSGTAIAQPRPPTPDAAAPIRLRAAEFTPAQGGEPALAPRLMARELAGANGIFLVQFRGPIEQSWKDQLSALGAELLDYVPDYAFKVRMNAAQAARTRALAEVAWVGRFHPAYKLGAVAVAPALYSVQIERGGNAAAATAAAAQAGATVLAATAGDLLVAADQAILERLAA